MRARLIGHTAKAKARMRRGASPPRRRSVVVVMVRCRFCQFRTSPLPLDGRDRTCPRCGNSLFAYHGPTLRELTGKVPAVVGRPEDVVAQLEAIAREVDGGV